MVRRRRGGRGEFWGERRQRGGIAFENQWNAALVGGPFASRTRRESDFNS